MHSVSEARIIASSTSVCTSQPTRTCGLELGSRREQLQANHAEPVTHGWKRPQFLA